MRTFCKQEFEEAGLCGDLTQASVSFSKEEGTLRALHFQSHPYMEDRLVRCVAGAIFDVAVDIRPGSKTFARWHASQLTPENGRQLYIPKGFAHGFQTLTPDTVVSYQMTVAFKPELTAGIRWNDPEIDVAWPKASNNQSPRDLSLPLLKEVDHSTLMPYANAGAPE